MCFGLKISPPDGYEANFVRRLQVKCYPGLWVQLREGCPNHDPSKWSHCGLADSDCKSSVKFVNCDEPDCPHRYNGCVAVIALETLSGVLLADITAHEAVTTQP